jgi:hypothetical protein
MNRPSYALASLLLSLTSASAALSQTTQQTSSGSIGSSILGAGTRVTIAMVDSVTTVNVGASYTATVSMGLPGSANVPQGSPAQVKVVQNTGYPATYSLQLTSLTINGQTTAVTGGAPILNAAGTAVNNATNSASNAVGNAMNRLLGGGKQPKAAATVKRTPAVTGTALYVPSGSSVIFTLTTALPATQTAQGQPGAAGTTGMVQPTAATGAPGGATTSATVVYEQIQYQLQGCQRQAPHIICSVTVTNLRGGDAMLNGAGGAYYIDQSGNRVNASMRTIANCAGWGPCQMLPNITMAGKWEFIDQDNHAQTLVRLQIAEDAKPVAQFTQVPVN